jgi:hypothetical protein
VRPGEPERLAQEVDKEKAGFDLGAALSTVDGHRDLNRSGHYQLLLVANAIRKRTLSQPATVARGATSLGQLA